MKFLHICSHWLKTVEDLLLVHSTKILLFQWHLCWEISEERSLSLNFENWFETYYDSSSDWGLASLSLFFLFAIRSWASLPGLSRTFWLAPSAKLSISVYDLCLQYLCLKSSSDYASLSVWEFSDKSLLGYKRILPLETNSYLSSW